VARARNEQEAGMNILEDRKSIMVEENKIGAEKILSRVSSVRIAPGTPFVYMKPCKCWISPVFPGLFCCLKINIPSKNYCIIYSIKRRCWSWK
jgi:hypothetical protein